MTTKAAIHFANCLKNNWTIDFADMEEFCDMAIRALGGDPWNSVLNGLPKKSGTYIVYLRQGTEVDTPEWMGGEPLSYVTEMEFNAGQYIWEDEHEAYNAILDHVDTEDEFHVTHWMNKPQKPEEGCCENGRESQNG